MRFLKNVFLMACIVFAVTGCKENLYSGLSEGEANEMVLTLLNRGIDASKVQAGKAGFAVVVEKEDFVKAVEIIKEHSLPRTKYQSLGQVFSGQGMISSQLEEQARLSFALSEELSATFSKIDGVLDARVHVVLVHHDQASGVTTPPSAAVFIRHVKDSPVINMVSAIKDTAARSVPGLTNDLVSVMLETYDENIIIPKKMDESWFKGPLGYLLLGLGVMLLTLGGVLAFVKVKFKTLNLTAKSEDTSNKEK